MNDAMRQAFAILTEEKKRLREQGSHLAADRLESAADYIIDAADELAEENHADASEAMPWGPAYW